MKIELVSIQAVGPGQADFGARNPELQLGKGNQRVGEIECAIHLGVYDAGNVLSRVRLALGSSTYGVDLFLELFVCEVCSSDFKVPCHL